MGRMFFDPGPHDPSAVTISRTQTTPNTSRHNAMTAMQPFITRWNCA